MVEKRVRKIALSLPFFLFILTSEGFHQPGILSVKSFTAKSLSVPTVRSSFKAISNDNEESPSYPTKNMSFAKVLWRFTRPHTIIGSALAIPSLHLFASPSLRQGLSSQTFISVVFAMIPSLLMNLYIVGLNQITDVEIDKINKPTLPIAAGDLSEKKAIIIVLVSLISSLAFGFHPVLGTQGLNVALWGSMILGTLYSLPPFRLKRHPILAAICIVSVRGAIINAGFFAHAKSAVLGSSALSVLGCLSERKCFLSSLFFAIFGIVIALMKDVPDVVGDAKFNIRSLTVRIGPKNVFVAMKNLLSALFLFVGASFTRAAFVESTIGGTCCRGIVGLSAFAAGLSTQKEAVGVNPEDSSMVYKYYMHLWKLFYLSYLALPFVR